MYCSDKSPDQTAVRACNRKEEVGALIALILVGILFVSCKQAQKPVNGSISMRLVHPESTQIVLGGLPSDMVDFTGYSLLPAHPAATGEGMPNQYWVSDDGLISHTDLASAKMFMPQTEGELLTREQYDALKKQTGSATITDTNIDPLFGKNYEDYLDRHGTRPGIELTFSSAGKTKLASVTEQNVGRQMAIVVDGQVLLAAQIWEPISGGVVQISGVFSEEEVEAIIRKIYGE
jgi:hypothetical protein